MKNIRIGVVHISDWNYKRGKMFSYNFYYDKNNEFYEKSYEEDVKECDPKEVVLLPNTEYTLVISYPVTNNYKVKITTGKSVMTRIKLAYYICKHYKNMYAEEDGSSGGDPGHIPNMLNRSRSEGKYGIWGHELGDLILINASISKKNVITLGVDS